MLLYSDCGLPVINVKNIDKKGLSYWKYNAFFFF